VIDPPRELIAAAAGAIATFTVHTPNHRRRTS